MKKIKGFTLIELLIVVAIIAILAAIAVPNFLEAQVRSKVSRVRSDHRSLATAIEAYFVDNNTYPASTVTKANNAYATFPGTALDNCRTFRLRLTDSNINCMTLTTPVAYVTSLFADPFADSRGATFPYYSTKSGWIMGSWGPDTDQEAADGGDLEWCKGAYFVTRPVAQSYGNSAVETVYNSWPSHPSTTLLVGGNGTTAFTYDSTNGTVSEGDLWRVKQ